jgi:hypothetical protein
MVAIERTLPRRQLRTDEVECMLSRPVIRGLKKHKLPVLNSKTFVRDQMKIGPILFTLAAVFAAVVICFAADVNTGTWKLNNVKSKNVSDENNFIMVIAAVGDSVKISEDGIDDNGKPWHDEWTGKFNGKDYPVTGDPDTDTRAYKPVNDRTLALTAKKGGKIVEAGRVVYSADGKTRTVTETVANATGVKTRVTELFDKQ